MGAQLTFQTATKTEAGYLAQPAGEAQAAVLVLHAWWGLNSVFTELCDRLAQAGFVAFAPDLNAGQIATSVDAAQALMEARDNERTEAAALAGLDYLQNHAAQGKPIGVIGFSMGAAWAIVLSTARPEDVAAVVLFYGAYPVDFAGARASYLGHFAEQDEWEPLEGVRQMEDAMRAAGRDIDIHIYPATSHWFFEPDRPEYDPQAAELAWQRTLDFLRKCLIREG